jgi:protein-S-isoprenylcysteine O-methyltransferase Ste14
VESPAPYPDLLQSSTHGAGASGRLHDPADLYSGSCSAPAAELGKILVTTGPYSAIRHPIYSGVILAMVGTTVAVSLFWLVAVVLLGAYFLYSAVMEERYMAEVFPDAYPRYKQSSKMLIPFIL